MERLDRVDKRSDKVSVLEEKEPVQIMTRLQLGLSKYGNQLGKGTPGIPRSAVQHATIAAQFRSIAVVY